MRIQGIAAVFLCRGTDFEVAARAGLPADVAPPSHLGPPACVSGSSGVMSAV